MEQTPIPRRIVDEALRHYGMENPGAASIREIRRLIDRVEEKQELRFIRMEMGIPGLPVPEIALDAERAALASGVASVYPPVAGLPALKGEISRFVKLFLNLEVDPAGCVPTVGSINGSYAAFMVAGRARKERNAVLFLDPGFPVHKQQAKMVGLESRSFDVYRHRGRALEARLEEALADGTVAALLYSNPNNPAWICFNEEELEIIGRLARKYEAVVIEDLAYVAMDFRVDYGEPGEPPFQPTVGNYTDDYLLLISSSKAFSYAGQRIGMLCVSDHLMKRRYPDLKRYYNNDQFGEALILGTLYATTAGVPHSVQHGLTALLQATNRGEYRFLDEVRRYGRRAEAMKDAFAANGFHIVYDTDIDRPIADGFYFTVSYPGFSGEELIREFLYYGISAISLGQTGSERREGIRACVSLINEDAIPELRRRLERFRREHGG